MKATSTNQIKKTLLELEPVELSTLVLRMAKYKKENKELLSYLLYESADEGQFIESVKSEIDEAFDTLVYSGSYKYTKQIRKILRLIQKPIKYSGLPATQVELLLHFTGKLKPIVEGRYASNVLMNIYIRQVKLIAVAMSKLHEDIQYDYKKQFEDLAITEF